MTFFKKVDFELSQYLFQKVAKMQKNSQNINFRTRFLEGKLFPLTFSFK